MWAPSPRGYPQPEDKNGYLSATYDLADYCLRCGIGRKQSGPFRFKRAPALKNNSILQLRWILQTRWDRMGRPAEGWVWCADTRSEHFEKSTLKEQHKKALRLSRVRPFVLYSLRHTFLTRLGESGCDAWTLARIAGHSSVAMSARYVHPSEDAVLFAR